MLPIPTDSIGLYARSRPNKMAARELLTGESWTYAELDQAVGRLAGYLHQRGCREGDRLVVVARNTVYQVMLHLACARAGVIYVPLNWRLSATELANLVERAAPALLLCDQGCADLLEGQDKAESLAEFVAASRDTPVWKDGMQDPDRPSLLLFTSGTSGKPKGVLLSERNLEQSGINFTALTAVDGNSCFLCEAPMFHVIGLVANIRPVLQQGGSILVSDGFEPQRTLNWLSDAEMGISHYLGVPQMIESFRQQADFDSSALKRLTAIVSGGAPHATEDLRAWLDEGVCLVSGFGMSESGTVLGMPTDLQVIRSKLGSAGINAPGMQIRLVDGDGQDCPPGQAGEIWLRGDSVMRGYWNDEETTAETFADGWFKSGDIARCDEDGFFWIVDRKKDMFISGGENIYPAEIEALLKAYPGLREQAVVGIPDERWGEVGCLVIVPDGSRDIDEDELLAFLRTQLASYKIPKKVVRVEALPRTSTGKLQKPRLRERLLTQ